MSDSETEPKRPKARPDPAQEYDLVVIGGGINGAGIAYDAAARGLRCLLLEAHDFGGGTSSWSTRLIHGGLRYLEYGEIDLVRESLHERTRLRKNAAHLVRPLRITIPIYRGSKRGRWLVRLGMLAYDLLSFGKSMPRHRMLSAKELSDQEPGLASDGLSGGASYFDAQVTFAERLVLENVIAAAANGATVRNYCPAVCIESHAAGHTVTYTDPDGGERRATAPAVVNAAGPWVDKVLALRGETEQRLMGGTKGSHIVVGAFQGAPTDAIYVEAQADGRPIFIVPWNDQYLIGTTDIRIDGDPREARASDAEIDYLLSETNRVFPGANLDAADIHFAYAGVRPLPYQEKGPESAITRRHIIKHHQDAPGLFSIIGGKLTTYRNLAEQTVDRVQRQLRRRKTPCVTQTTPLPGSTSEEPLPATALTCLSEAGRRRLMAIYGARTTRLCELASEEPALDVALDGAGTVLAAEVALAVREEFARELTDIVHRRMMIGLSADARTEVVLKVAAVAAAEFAWTDVEAERQLADLNAYNAALRKPS